jgi:putative hemolysin
MGRPKALEEGLTSGSLEVRLARSEAEIIASQNLRYRVFYEEMGAKPTPQMAREERDFDSFDPFCDHLLVFDHCRGEDPAKSVVGTYRLIRRAAAARQGGFYTAGEFDIDKITSLEGEILELGRSCVGRDHRNRPTMQIMWGGIAAYAAHYDIQIMFGCGSLHGTDIGALAEHLSFLYHFHLAPDAFRPRAVEDRYVKMDLLAADEINKRQVLKDLPPLIKGYLRLGGFVGDGAGVDEQFSTTDVCILVKTDLITEKYTRHYDLDSREKGDT